MVRDGKLRDDGACRHLQGMRIPPIALCATNGDDIDLSRIPGCLVLYIYPRTSRPGEVPLPGWDTIPGARGCTAQSCAFREHMSELRSLNVVQVFGLSTQDNAYQREMAERLRLPFPVLSDARLRFASALRLPTFTVVGRTLLKRVTLHIEDGVIEHVFYPIDSPEQNPHDVVAWLRSYRQQPT